MAKFVEDIVTPGFIGSGNRAVAPAAPVQQDFSAITDILKVGVELFKEKRNKDAIGDLVTRLAAVGADEENTPLLKEITDLGNQLEAGGFLEDGEFRSLTQGEIVQRRAKRVALRNQRQSALKLKRDSIIQEWIVDNPDLINFVDAAKKATATAGGGEGVLSAVEAEQKALQDMGNALATSTGNPEFRNPTFLRSERAAAMFDEASKIARINQETDSHVAAGRFNEQTEILRTNRKIAATQELAFNQFMSLVDAGDFDGALDLIKKYDIASADLMRGIQTEGGQKAAERGIASLTAYKNVLIDLVSQKTEKEVFEGINAAYSAIAEAGFLGSIDQRMEILLIDKLAEWGKHLTGLGIQLQNKSELNKHIRDSLGSITFGMFRASQGLSSGNLGNIFNFNRDTSPREVPAKMEARGVVFNELVRSMSNDPAQRETLKSGFTQFFNDSALVKDELKRNPKVANEFLKAVADPNNFDLIQEVPPNSNIRELVIGQTDNLYQMLRDDMDDLQDRGIISNTKQALGLSSDPETSSFVTATISSRGEVFLQPKPGLEGETLAEAQRYADSFNSSSAPETFGLLARTNAHLIGNKNYKDHANILLSGSGVFQGEVEQPEEPKVEETPDTPITTIEQAEAEFEGIGELMRAYQEAESNGNSDRAGEILDEILTKYPGFADKHGLTNAQPE